MTHSVCRSVGRSVCVSVGMSVGLSVGMRFAPARVRTYAVRVSAGLASDKILVFNREGD